MKHSLKLYKEVKAVASILYNMGAKGLNKKHAIASLEESVDIWIERATKNLIPLIKQGNRYEK